MKKLTLTAVAVVAAAVAHGATVCGTGREMPRAYVPAMLSNGSLCMTTDASSCRAAESTSPTRSTSRTTSISTSTAAHVDCRPRHNICGWSFSNTTFEVKGRKTGIGKELEAVTGR